jgi:FlaG/FlaF family flagellin (archaellin)
MEGCSSMNIPTRFRPPATDDRAISPVIGVILMISLAVLVASMIGGFVLGMGDNLQAQAPDAGFTFDYNANDGTISITHDGGQPFTADNTQSLMVRQTGSATATEVWVDGTTGAFPVTAGDQITPSFTLASGDEVRVVWISADESSTDTLDRFRIP